MNKQRMVQTIGLFLKRSSSARGRYLRDKHIFAAVGENVRYQPRLIPLYPELIKLHNNIAIAAGVRFVTHDGSYTVLDNLNIGHFPEHVGCIEVMDNVFIGYNATILPNVRIGENVIVGAGAVVTKDLEPNGVYVGTPAKRISSFEAYVKKCAELPGGGYPYPCVKRNQNISHGEVDTAWNYFEKERLHTDRK